MNNNFTWSLELLHDIWGYAFVALFIILFIGHAVEGLSDWWKGRKTKEPKQ